MTTAAESGHLSSSLSAVELMTGLMFSGVFRADLQRPEYPNNDRLIFSKGHAAPLLYALYAAAGRLTPGQLMKLRQFSSALEGHPTRRFSYTEVPTGSLGQGLAVALGEAIAARMDKLPYHVYCLLGDSEMMEGSVWEAIQLAGHLGVHQLVGILDLNGLGQSGPTLLRRNATAMARRIGAFGWTTILVNGHDHEAVVAAYRKALTGKSGPTMIIAKTTKGKGVKLIEGKEGWHGRVLSPKQAEQALRDLGRINDHLRGRVATPLRRRVKALPLRSLPPARFRLGQEVSPRLAIGQALQSFGRGAPRIVVVDGEVKNSTYTDLFGQKYPKRFVEGYIAEQLMVGLSTGLARRGWLPVAATFAAFWTRAFDQLRLASYADTHQVFIGTHPGVHIGQDGVSQMGLQDVSLFRTLEGSVLLVPSDAVAAWQLLHSALRTKGLTYVRALRADVPVLYPARRRFPVGGSHVLRRSRHDRATIVATGIAVHEALLAADTLAKENIRVRVIDCYSLKPLDLPTLQRAVRETQRLIVVEDHYPEGGVAEAIRSALGKDAGRVTSLAVRKTPRSGRPNQVLTYEGIDAQALIHEVRRR